VLEDTRPGDSISVNGCCLTVAERTEGSWTADVMAETLDKTGIGALAAGDRVNLERAVTAGTRLGGHLVQGHVDAVGHVVRREPGDHWDVVTITLPPGLAPYLVDKGSITVDGVSLTVVSAPLDRSGDQTFTVSLIPETLQRTTLGFRRPGDPVNLEVDVIGKYVARQLAARLDGHPPHLRPSEGTPS
jgi:riboflavin synthase